MRKETAEAMNIVEPSQSNARILDENLASSRLTLRNTMMATVPTPIRGRLIQNIHLHPECEL
jgi:hypothetical protein